MALVALIVAIASALIALLTLATTWAWRRQQQYAARTSYSLLVSRKSVVADRALRNWTVGGVHDSVWELRNELSVALPGLPVRYLELGTKMMMASRDHAIALRDWSHNPATVNQMITEIPQANDLHLQWVDRIEKLAAQMMPNPPRRRNRPRAGDPPT